MTLSSLSKSRYTHGLAMKKENFSLPENFILRLLDEVPAAVFCKDADDEYRFVFWNKYAEKFWGLPMREVVGKTDYDMFPKEQADFFRAKDEETMRAAQTVIIPQEELHAPGGSYWLRTRKVPLGIGNRRFLLGISEDITLERKLWLDLQAERAVATAAQRIAAVGELAGGVAHEVNSPLSALLIQLELVRTQIDHEGQVPDRKELQAFLDTMYRVATKIVKVTKTLYSYATYSHRASPEFIDSVEIARDAITLNREKLRLADIEVRTDFPIDPLPVRVRPMDILQAVLNLLHNSLEAMGQGERWIELGARRNGKNVELSVTDSGVGIPPGRRALIMEPFNETGKEGPHGVGLSVAKKIAETHGGSLTLDVDAEHTRFVLSLPLA